MSLLAEELVEEWLNRQGYFTIRGIKLGRHEIDLLAIRLGRDGPHCRQIEVQASVRPISYISKVPKAVQDRTGRPANSATAREDDELRAGVQEWIDKKYGLAEKQSLLQSLVTGPWSRELVVRKVKYQRELEFFQQAGVAILQLADIVAALKNDKLLIHAASGGNLVELVAMETGGEKPDT